MWREKWLNRFDAVTTVILGRRSFLGHQRVWTEKGRPPTNPRDLVDCYRRLDHVEKFGVSRRPESPGWDNSRIMNGDLSQIMAKLKGEKGGNIIAEGGPRLIHELLRRGLADDCWLVVQPVVDGEGPQYGGPMPAQATLKLLSSKTMEDGERLLPHETVRGLRGRQDAGVVGTWGQIGAIHSGAQPSTLAHGPSDGIALW